MYLHIDIYRERETYVYIYICYNTINIQSIVVQTLDLCFTWAEDFVSSNMAGKFPK